MVMDVRRAAIGQDEVKPVRAEVAAPPHSVSASVPPEPRRFDTADAVQPPTTPPTAPAVDSRANSVTDVVEDLLGEQDEQTRAHGCRAG